RRRHTRSTRDWSSDVCSSDLPLRRRRPPHLPKGGLGVCGGRRRWRGSVSHPDSVDLWRSRPRSYLFFTTFRWTLSRTPPELLQRSEERRVGNEWRTGWWFAH